MMKLFYSPGACSLSPHIVLRETATPFELVKADIRNKKTADGGDYRKVNPSGMVPALVLDDGTVLTEGPAIVQYIADKAGATNLAPANGTLARYQMQSWLNFVGTELHKTFSPLFSPIANDGAKEFARTRLMDRLGVLEARLADRPYLMGNELTLPDIYAFVVLRWVDAVKLDVSGFPNIAAYRARIAERPAVKAALAAEA